MLNPEKRELVTEEERNYVGNVKKIQGMGSSDKM